MLEPSLLRPRQWLVGVGLLSIGISNRGTCRSHLEVCADAGDGGPRKGYGTRAAEQAISTARANSDSTVSSMRKSAGVTIR